MPETLPLALGCVLQSLHRHHLLQLLQLYCSLDVTSSNAFAQSCFDFHADKGICSIIARQNSDRKICGRHLNPSESLLPVHDMFSLSSYQDLPLLLVHRHVGMLLLLTMLPSSIRNSCY